MLANFFVDLSKIYVTVCYVSPTCWHDTFNFGCYFGDLEMRNRFKLAVFVGPRVFSYLSSTKEQAINKQLLHL